MILVNLSLYGSSSKDPLQSIFDTSPKTSAPDKKYETFSF